MEGRIEFAKMLGEITNRTLIYRVAFHTEGNNSRRERIPVMKDTYEIIDSAYGSATKPIRAADSKA
ncbi:hypothetical protein C5167_034686 [Papaver somniferum]|uniref:Uncharacterized protein n=1 Tax=Papaver somniferum TaxID=3469 RepID=A0A4Y7KHA3_PAPSO|nr:hypothetical protein C5167_034686 [Papaver somniferum]